MKKKYGIETDEREKIKSISWCEDTEDIISICRDFQNKVGLKCPYNIQFKYLDGIPYFLEVNTRMSGGIQMACYASGVNIPQLALKKISGEELDWSCKYEEKILAQVLQPVTID